MRVPPTDWFAAALTVYRTFGARGIRLRATHEIRRALDWYRVVPRFTMQSVCIGDISAFRVAAHRLLATVNYRFALDRANQVVSGRHQAFRWQWRELPRGAADWLRQPGIDRSREARAPWWKTSHLDPHFGDIKDLWEPARFAWTYDLVRAWLITGDDKYPAAFCDLLEAWEASSPPFYGPHWSCGQETAIRAAALLYAEANFVNAPCVTAAAKDRIVRVLAASGERIADAIGYAVSQRNNHAISEAAGLVLLGVRFRGVHPEADGWLESGRRLLERLVREQFATDGWYIQHSFTYQRLALDQLVLAERALRSTELGLSSGAVARIRASADLLLAVMDTRSGIVPNHGANDGAFAHPITLAPYRDFRPVLTAIGALWDHQLPDDVSPDREVLAWLDLGEPPRAPPLSSGIRTGESGWAAIRAGSTAIFLRAGRYHARPSHQDPLHVDVRIDGREVIIDPGTFAYNAPPPWRNALAGTLVHNGPVVSARDPAARGPRFLWLSWPKAEIVSARWSDGSAIVVAEVPGRVRRTVAVEEGRVEVTDELLDEAASTFVVTWTLHPDVDPSAVSSESSRKVYDAEVMGVRGWFSPHYGERIAVVWIEVTGAHGRPATTRIGTPSRMPPQRTRAGAPHR